MVSADRSGLLEKTWFAKRDGKKHVTAARTEYHPMRTVRLHQVIANEMGINLADHRNRCAVDNRDSNLREATPSQNAMNRRKVALLSKGVTLNKGRFRARITVDGKCTYLGRFDTEKEAAAAYAQAAAHLHGEFASVGARA